jgi:hypothetical protein
MISSTVAPSLSAALMCRRVHVCDGRIAGNVQKLGQLGREDIVDVDRGARGQERFRSCRVLFKEFRLVMGSPRREFAPIDTAIQWRTEGSAGSLRRL